MISQQQIIEILIGNREIAFAILSGLLGSLIHFRKTGRFPLGRLPLRALRQAWGGISAKYFTTARPREVPALLVDAEIDEIEAQLRNIHFESVDLYSYEYEGEVLNLRRPDGPNEKLAGGPIPTELHVRFFKTADGRLLCLAHHEASRFEAWKAHIKETLFSWERGREKFSGVLSAAGIGHTKIASEKSAGIEVTS